MNNNPDHWKLINEWRNLSRVMRTEFLFDLGDKIADALADAPHAPSRPTDDLIEQWATKAHGAVGAQPFHERFREIMAAGDAMAEKLREGGSRVEVAEGAEDRVLKQTRRRQETHAASGEFNLSEDFREAADRIDALAAQVETLTKERDEALDFMESAQDQRDEARRQTQAAEASLSAVVKAARRAVDPDIGDEEGLVEALATLSTAAATGETK